MDDDAMKGRWKQLKGEVTAMWGKLTDDDLMEIDGQKDRLVGKIQERYSLAKEAAMEQIAQFEKKYL